MSEWKPIESAPRDGTYILACREGGNPDTVNLWFLPVAACWAAYHPNATGKVGWRTSRICGNKLDGLTHWMPLPEPPK